MKSLFLSGGLFLLLEVSSFLACGLLISKLTMENPIHWIPFMLQISQLLCLTSRSRCKGLLVLGSGVPGQSLILRSSDMDLVLGLKTSFLPAAGSRLWFDGVPGRVQVYAMGPGILRGLSPTHHSAFGVFWSISHRVSSLSNNSWSFIGVT